MSDCKKVFNIYNGLYLQASQNGDTLRSQTIDLSSSPGSNCTTDTNAKDFSSKISNFPSETVEVCARIKTYSQTTTPKTLCALVPGMCLCYVPLQTKFRGLY